MVVPEWPLHMVQSGMSSLGHLSAGHVSPHHATSSVAGRASDVPITVDRSDPRPLATQIADQVRAGATSGMLRPGTRLPSTRRLAADLGVARGVTEQAWDQLRAEGWLVSRIGSGSWLSHGPLPESPRTTARQPAAVPPRVEPVMLDAGTPWRSSSPALTSIWRRAWRETALATPPRGYAHAEGLPELRELVAERIARTRGIEVRPDEVLVTGGTVAAFRQVLTELPVGAIAVEDPGYRAVVHTAIAAGRAEVSLPVDGPPGSLAGCTAAYVTPAHQHPTGRVMPATERIELLRVARRDGCVVIEDDYDSEFRYDVAPIPALAALDRDLVAWLGTSSKTVLPGLRLGWAVLPPPLHAAVLERRRATLDLPPWPLQRAMVTLLRDGYVDALARAARRVYAERARRVVEVLGPHLHQLSPVAGMYSTWACPQPVAVAARDAARAAGFEVMLLADYCRRSDLTGLLIGFGGPSDAELERALTVIVAAVKAAGDGQGPIS